MDPVSHSAGLIPGRRKRRAAPRRPGWTC